MAACSNINLMRRKPLFKASLKTIERSLRDEIIIENNLHGPKEKRHYRVQIDKFAAFNSCNKSQPKVQTKIGNVNYVWDPSTIQRVQMVKHQPEKPLLNLPQRIALDKLKLYHKENPQASKPPPPKVPNKPPQPMIESFTFKPMRSPQDPLKAFQQQLFLKFFNNTSHSSFTESSRISTLTTLSSQRRHL